MRSLLLFTALAGDPRDWNASPGAAAKAGRRGQADRFILKFVKP